MTVVFCGICPHPPIVVPEVGGKEAARVAATQEALLELGRRLKASGARTLVIITPHGPVFQELVGINGLPVLEGDLGRFRASSVKFRLDNDLSLVKEIGYQAESLGLASVIMDAELAGRYDLDLKLDHGVTVPLYFLQKAGVDLPVVHVSMAIASPEKLYMFGVAVRRAAESLGCETALLASGDLSHCLTHDAPGGFHPRGAEFDRQIAGLLSGPDVEGLLNMDQILVDQAGECGYRTVVMMLGALDGREVKGEVLSYEGPFGVGYLVASYEPGPVNTGRSLLAKMEAKRREELRRRETESYLVKVARETLENHVRGLPREEAGETPAEFKRKAGVFVSIKKGGSLRGCIGTVEPVRSDIVEEVKANAISAGLHDPRFRPIGPEELDELEYSVDVLQPAKPVSGLDELDPYKYGVIVRSGRKSGLLLPNLEGIDTAGEQVDIARQKAGIRPGEPVSLERFEVVRYK